MAFAPEYVRSVLNENFEDAKSLFLGPLLSVQRAHLVMLAQEGIIPAEDARKLRDALDSISLDEVRRTVYDGSCEDLFFYIDRLIVEHCGEDAAGRLHVARSRNDVDMTMYRMQQREFVLGLMAAAHELRHALLDIAGRHRETVFAACTHTQPAQPTTLAHYMLAVIEQLERDDVRLRAAFETTNRCPLGSCAITGTGFPIDRELTSRLLGFESPTGNTYGSIATVDYLLQSTSAAAVLAAGLGRFIQDMLLWCTAEVSYLRLSDGFVQSSSIMPQKRNPVALEHARVIGSKALGQSTAILVSVHNTPFGDIVDTEDDLQPLVARMFLDATRAVRLVAAAMKDAQFDVARMEAMAGERWTTLTELADGLTREKGWPFKKAHAIAASLVEARRRDPERPLSATLDAAAIEIAGNPVGYSEDRLRQILSPHHFVEVRRTAGGPAPEETALAVAASRLQLDDDRARLSCTRAAADRAQASLAERSAAL